MADGRWTSFKLSTLAREANARSSDVRLKRSVDMLVVRFMIAFIGVRASPAEGVEGKAVLLSYRFTTPERELKGKNQLLR